MAVTPSNRSIDYDAVLSSCLEAFLGKDPVDNFFKDHVLLEVLKDKGCMQSQDGGERIRQPVTIGDNTTVASYTSYDVIDTTPQNEFSTLWYDWRQLAGSVSISGLEETQNRGEHAIFNLLSGKTQVLLQTMREEINYQLLGKTVASGVWSAGDGTTASTTGTDLDPLCEALSRDTTQSVAVGNINKNTYSYWRTRGANLSSDTAGTYNNTFGNDVTTWAELLIYLNRLYYYCSRGGGGRPDVIITSQMGFEGVESAMRDKTRYTQQGDAHVAFDNIYFKTGCPMYWDEMMPDILNGYVYDSSSYDSETYYFLNTRWMKLIYDSQHNFSPTPFLKPENQDAKTALMLFYGNLCWTQLRKHGVAFGYDPTVAA